MKKALIALAIIIAAGLGWYLISPLFINKVVDEGFPIDLESMSEEEKMEMEKEMLEEYAQKPDTVVEDAMPDMPTSPNTPTPTPENTDNQPILISRGEFQDADDFHQGSGSATLYQLPDGINLLRLENFEVTNGPDLRVILTESPTPTKDDIKNGLELEKLKGNKGNQNYEIAPGIDLSLYKSVVIYCKPFSVIFSVASLN